MKNIPARILLLKQEFMCLKQMKLWEWGWIKALKAKKTVKNPTESFCIVYDKDKHENSCC